MNSLYGRHIGFLGGGGANRDCGHSHRPPQFFGYPILTQEQVKLRSSNLAGTFTGCIQNFPHGHGRMESGKATNFVCTFMR